MKRTLQELLDEAEQSYGFAKEVPTIELAYYWLYNSIAASTLAHAVALASAVKYDKEPNGD